MVKVKVEHDTRDYVFEESGSFAVGAVVTREEGREIATNSFIAGAISQEKLVLVLVNLLTSVIDEHAEDSIDALSLLITAHDELVKDINSIRKITQVL